MDQLVMWNLVVGFVAPFLIAVVNRPDWDKRLRIGITVAFCIVAGFLTAYFGGQLIAVDIVTSILITLVTAITTYKNIFKPVGITGKIEEKTSPTPKIYVDSDAVG